MSPAPCAQSKPPKDLFDEAILETLLGKGSFGSVFKAQWRGMEVALKVLPQPACSCSLIAGHPMVHVFCLLPYTCILGMVLHELPQPACPLASA